MQVEPSSVTGVDLIGPRAPGFIEALTALLGRAPDDVITPALPYSIIVRNNHVRTLALLGIRFDMVSRQVKTYSVVHYADTLRNPERGDLKPGAMRFICAEPRYTDLVLRRETTVDQRGPMNLKNLRTILRISASLDCAAFVDGEFEGPDTLGVFDRFAAERAAELAFLDEVLAPDCNIETLLKKTLESTGGQSEDPALAARRALVKKLQEGFSLGGIPEVAARVSAWKPRIPLWRADSN
ncbi:MAG TPA: hypothetical protein VG297_07655 [Bryobacteraceae bacterium]|jgi:hypothetical protein|nr:hypothetical protein [Bryobacteraceae bacterium]